MKQRVSEDCYFYKIRQWLLNRKARKLFAYFGKGSEFRPGAYAAYTSHISIGSNVVIRPGCRLFADEDTYIFISDNVLLGHGVQIYTNNHAFSRNDIPIHKQGYDKRKDVVLKDGCWVGANVIILPDVNIGRNAVVGAGSVVTKDIPDFEVWAGNPAKKIKGEIKNVERKEILSNSPSKGRLYRHKR